MCQACSCSAPKTQETEKKTYVCSQCNTFKDAGANEPAPECCGKKMNSMD